MYQDTSPVAMPQWAELQRYMIVGQFVCVSVCMSTWILQDGRERRWSCIAISTRRVVS